MNAKPGYKTTEFWLVVVSNVLGIVTALNGVISPKDFLIVTSVLNGVYATLRSLSKNPEITTIVDNSTNNK